MSNNNQIKKDGGKKYYEHKPIREFKAKLSEDGKFWIFKDITTHLVPRSYITKVESDQGKGLSEEPIGSKFSFPEKMAKRND